MPDRCRGNVYLLKIGARSFGDGIQDICKYKESNLGRAFHHVVGNIIFLNKLSAFRTVSPCFLVCSLLYPVEVIFPSKSLRKV